MLLGSPRTAPKILRNQMKVVKQMMMKKHYHLVYACGLLTSCKVSLISDKLSVYESVTYDFHVDMFIVLVVCDTCCPAKTLFLVASL